MGKYKESKKGYRNGVRCKSISSFSAKEDLGNKGRFHWQESQSCWLTINLNTLVRYYRIYLHIWTIYRKKPACIIMRSQLLIMSLCGIVIIILHRTWGELRSSLFSDFPPFFPLYKFLTLVGLVQEQWFFFFLLPIFISITIGAWCLQYWEEDRSRI